MVCGLLKGQLQGHFYFRTSTTYSKSVDFNTYTPFFPFIKRITGLVTGYHQIFDQIKAVITQFYKQGLLSHPKTCKI